MFRQLLDRVREQGYISVKNTPLLTDALPIMYTEDADSDAPDAMPYHTSGGRSVLLVKEGTCYRVKGCDPFAKLTKIVEFSNHNQIIDVSFAYLNAIQHLEFHTGQPFMYAEGKPFGVLTFSQVQYEKETLAKLAEIYEKLAIENPCAFIAYAETGIEIQGEKTYQSLFRLPRMEADFRVREFEGLLTDRLDDCTPERIAKKTQNINRLFGRFIYWAGINAVLLSYAGALPTKNSFVPQNWVISKVRDGYGIFRVDHSSTKIMSPNETYEKLVAPEKGVPNIINNFSVFPGRVQVAANPKAYAIEEGTPFYKILSMTRSKMGFDESLLLKAHNDAFSLGTQCGIAALAGNPDALRPIPEEMFSEALA